MCDNYFTFLFLQNICSTWNNPYKNAGRMFHVEHPPGVWMEKKENAILKGRIQTLQNPQEHDCERLLYGKTAGLILKIFN